MVTAAGDRQALARWLPATGLLLALSGVWLFAGELGVFHDDRRHDWNTAKNMAIAANLPVEPGFMFWQRWKDGDGTVRYEAYNRFPIGSFVLIWLATAPFEGDLSSQLAAARMLMLAFFCGAVALAYLALARLAGSRTVALGTTLLAFSSLCPLFYSDVVSNEASVGLFAVMLVFHGMVLFKTAGGREESKAPKRRAVDRRFLQLAAKICVALLLDWHVYGLLLPFLALGAAAEAASAWRASASATVARRLATAAAGVLRGSCARLGLLALLFGVGVLGHNIYREYAVLDAETVAELPSVQSALLRTGFLQVPDVDRTAWDALAWQIRQIGALCLPFAFVDPLALLEGRGDNASHGDRDRPGQVRLGSTVGDALPFWTGICGILGAFVGIAIFKRPRSPSAAMVLAGVGWLLLAPNNIGNRALDAYHFESVYHIGFPLYLFAAALHGARRLCGESATAFCAAAAVAVFALSSAATNWRYGPNVPAERARQMKQMAEFDAIAETSEGRTLDVAVRRRDRGTFVRNRLAMHFFLAGSFYRYQPRTDDLDRTPPDFVLAFERYPTPLLLTPDHSLVFLYEGGAHYDALETMFRLDLDQLRALLQTARDETPSASGEFDLYLRDRELGYVRTPCSEEDFAAPFFLHVVPHELSALPPSRQQHGFDNLDFKFRTRGAIFGATCAASVSLPDYAIARLRTGQIDDDGAKWQIEVPAS